MSNLISNKKNNPYPKPDNPYRSFERWSLEDSKDDEETKAVDIKITEVVDKKPTEVVDKKPTEAIEAVDIIFNQSL